MNLFSHTTPSFNAAVNSKYLVIYTVLSTTGMVFSDINSLVINYRYSPV